jgi:hypothetical protein
MFAELVDQRLMEEVLYILGVVESGRGSGTSGRLLLVAWLARINAYAIVRSKASR